LILKPDSSDISQKKKKKKKKKIWKWYRCKHWWEILPIMFQGFILLYKSSIFSCSLHGAFNTLSSLNLDSIFSMKIDKDISFSGWYFSLSKEFFFFFLLFLLLNPYHYLWSYSILSYKFHNLLMWWSQIFSASSLGMLLIICLFTRTSSCNISLVTFSGW